jgi:REP element-mobilizing transposase RayT
MYPTHPCGAAYHIMSRGVLRGVIFSSDENCARFLACLARAQERFRLDIFAFVLMTNHYHLFLRTREANLSRALQWLQTAYSVYYNRKHSRSGHVFQSRFKAIIVGEESYWTGLTMYIHLNPVRAGAAADAGDYRWSSYNDYVEEQKPHEWVKRKRFVVNIARDVAMHVLKTHTTLTNKRIGTTFGVASDAAAKASARMEKLAAKDSSLKTQIDRVVHSIFEV